MKTILISASALCLTLPALAEEVCPLSYETFEIGVPHTDMETCPESMEADGSYCRLSVVAEVATIFAFSEETDCITASQAYFEDQFTLTIK